MTRKKGLLMLPIEAAILQAAAALERRGEPAFHGFALAKHMAERDNARKLLARGTLYKALDRMQKVGWLESRWENALLAAKAQRPRRRLYQVTRAGHKILAQWRAETAVPHSHLKGRLATQ